MKPIVSAFAVGFVAFLLSACKRDFAARPEIQQEIKTMRSEGWEYIEMVGEARSNPEAREIRRSDSTGSLTVYAANTGVDGGGSPAKEWRKTFKSDGFEFLEVKTMTSPAGGYSLVFRKHHPTK